MTEKNETRADQPARARLVGGPLDGAELAMQTTPTTRDALSSFDPDRLRDLIEQVIQHRGGWDGVTDTDLTEVQRTIIADATYLSGRTPKRNSEEERGMAYDADGLLRDFSKHGVSCDDEGSDGWVDDNVGPIFNALLAAGWTPPTR